MVRRLWVEVAVAVAAMAAATSVGYANVPDVYGGGELFAFSGLDGESNEAHDFVGAFSSTAYGVDFAYVTAPTAVSFGMSTGQLADSDVVVATGDVLYVIDGTTQQDLLGLAFSAWHTLTGFVSGSVSVALESSSWHSDLGCWIVSDLLRTESIALTNTSQGTIGVAYGRSVSEACDRATEGAGGDFSEVMDARLSSFSVLPQLSDPGKDRLLKKCFSVMKVNTLTAEGSINYMWSTPDREPHREMWLWDSCFHSFAMNLFHPDISWQFLQSVLSKQLADGKILCEMDFDGISNIEDTQPPLLSWAVWENYQVTKNISSLQYAFPRLEKYIQWDMKYRDSNGNGLLEWRVQKSENCPCGESGMDNSPRWDYQNAFGIPYTMDNIDFSCFAAQEMNYLSLIALELNDTDKAEEWQAQASELSSSIHSDLWSSSLKFYTDRMMDGNYSEVKAVSMFTALLLPDIPEDHLQALLQLLQDPSSFNTVVPIASVSKDNAAYSTDMWRGPMWVNFNFLTAVGLKNHGYKDMANSIIESTITCMQKYYEKEGKIFEFYDSADEVDPENVLRKGTPSGSIRDYHWSAALLAKMLVELELQ
ncbi:FAD-dependent oxidoreductase [Pelomyxa schiedti]|nr:FAD-dependent oxidoreductase [Pelomyxa schiedti]